MRHMYPILSGIARYVWSLPRCLVNKVTITTQYLATACRGWGSYGVSLGAEILSLTATVTYGGCVAVIVVMGAQGGVIKAGARPLTDDWMLGRVFTLVQ